MPEPLPLRMNTATAQAANSLIVTGLQEDLGGQSDLTSDATIPPDVVATVSVVSRQRGTVCGVSLIAMTYGHLSNDVQVKVMLPDGSMVMPGSVIAQIAGPVRSLLTGERTVLNLLIHLSGVASKTAEFVARVNGCKAVILDTRKTLPGYRLLHKYAVKCGGGTNHRMGLFDGILIKDNHLAARGNNSPDGAVTAARDYLSRRGHKVPIEIEVDLLDQLRSALEARPDIILLDNMTIEQLATAVEIRATVSPATLLEASGGVTLESVRGIAKTGVDRISIGALTHSAPALDLGFDWRED
jgi:nicotinate-nucleotide pyrophosphorylase (carboxylating)